MGAYFHFSEKRFDLDQSNHRKAKICNRVNFSQSELSPAQKSMRKSLENEQGHTMRTTKLALPFSSLPALIFVDDEAEILAEYSEFLAAFDIAALTEQSPDRAVRTVVNTSTIRLVVTDLRMAERDGLSLIEQIRVSLPAGRQMAFILVTGDAEICDLEEDASVTLLRKPVEPLVLLATIQDALANAP